MRRVRLAAALVAGWTLVAVACGGGSEGAADRSAATAEAPPEAPAEAVSLGGTPVDDVLLVTVDTLRADALGFAGNREVRTPLLDRLAAGGLVFSRAYAHNVVTLPSHANILTGLHPYEHGVRDNTGFRLPESLPTAATLLRAAGFATGAFVGAFPVDSRFGLARGFDIYDDDYPKGEVRAEAVARERRGDEVVARATAWWRRNEGRRRFAWVHLYDPHAPYRPPEPFASEYRESPYLGEVAAVDAFLRPLVEPLLEEAAPRALVVVTSDHGEALGDHGETTHGLFAYEATLRVPLVIWSPGTSPARIATPARHVDLLPTLLEAAGVDGPEGLSGRSLVSSPPGESGPPVYFEALTASLDWGWAPLRGVLSGGHKLISLPVPELYDLAADPREERNLVEAERERVRDLLRQLPAESAWPPPRAAPSADERAALASLGYLGGTARVKESYSEADDPKRLVHLERKMHEMIDRFQTGRYEEAAGLGEEIVGERPDMGIAYYYLAQVELSRGGVERAIAVMEEARRRDAASAALLRQLGLSLSEVGRHPEALEVVGGFRDSQDPEALNALGLVLTGAGRHGEARSQLSRAAALDPQDPRSFQSLALVALNTGLWGEARDQAQAALALNEGLALSWNYLGTALYNLGERRAALSALQRSVALEPDNFDALYNAGVVAMEVGDREAAIDALRRFVAGAPPATYGPDIRQARSWLERLQS